MSNDSGQFDLFRSVNFPAVDAPASVPEVPISHRTTPKAAPKSTAATAFDAPLMATPGLPFIRVRDVAQRYSVSVPSWILVGADPIATATQKIATLQQEIEALLTLSCSLAI
jgi:hypothetical protein